MIKFGQLINNGLFMPIYLMIVLVLCTIIFIIESKSKKDFIFSIKAFCISIIIPFCIFGLIILNSNNIKFNEVIYAFLCFVFMALFILLYKNLLGVNLNLRRKHLFYLTIIPISLILFLKTGILNEIFTPENENYIFYIRLIYIGAVTIMFLYSLFIKGNKLAFIQLWSKLFHFIYIFEIIYYHSNVNFTILSKSTISILLLYLLGNSFYFIINNVTEVSDLFFYDNKYSISQKSFYNKIKSSLYLSTGKTKSYLINGSWGSGKTHIMNGVVNEIKQSRRNDFYFIELSVLEIDSLDALQSYLFIKLKDILKKENAYVGISSQLKEYIKSTVGIINKNHSVLVDMILPSNNKDYREEKLELNKLLIDVLKNKKIVLIIDDLERSSKNIILQYLFFVKELETFDNIISYYICDYDMLLESMCIDDSSSEVKTYYDNFFDKFFNMEIKLSLYEDESFELIRFDTFSETSQNNFSNLNEKVLELVNKKIKYKSTFDFHKNQVDVLNKYGDNYIEFISNPRNRVKLCDKYNFYVNIIKNNLIITNDVLEIIKKRKIELLIYIISYFEIKEEKIFQYLVNEESFIITAFQELCNFNDEFTKGFIHDVNSCHVYLLPTEQIHTYLLELINSKDVSKINLMKDMIFTKLDETFLNSNLTNEIIILIKSLNKTDFFKHFFSIYNYYQSGTVKFYYMKTINKKIFVYNFDFNYSENVNIFIGHLFLPFVIMTRRLPDKKNSMRNKIKFDHCKNYLRFILWKLGVSEKEIDEKLSLFKNKTSKQIKKEVMPTIFDKPYNKLKKELEKDKLVALNDFYDFLKINILITN